MYSSNTPMSYRSKKTYILHYNELFLPRTILPRRDGFSCPSFTPRLRVFPRHKNARGGRSEISEARVLFEISEVAFKSVDA